VTLEEDGRVLLRAVVDEYAISQSGQGRLLEMSGRGLAALLLDNESEAVEYSAATLTALLRAHAAPYGLTWENFTELRADGVYHVESGASQWTAVNGFTRYFGGFELRVTPEGELLPRKWVDDGKRLLIGEDTPVLELKWREQRYGVYSEVLVVDKVRKTVQSVKNQPFLSRGGSCRRVLYSPGTSTGAAMRYTGEYQIQRSKKGKRRLTAVLAGKFSVKPGAVVRMERGDIGVTGDFYIDEVRCSGGSGGAQTSLTMGRLGE
jgi:hypothetical protein